MLWLIVGSAVATSSKPGRSPLVVMVTRPRATTTPLMLHTVTTAYWRAPAPLGARGVGHYRLLWDSRQVLQRQHGGGDATPMVEVVACGRSGRHGRAAGAPHRQDPSAGRRSRWPG